MDPFDTKDIIKKLETIINDENKRAQICNSSVVINKKSNTDLKKYINE